MPELTEATPSGSPKGTPLREVPPAASLSDETTGSEGADREALVAAMRAQREAREAEEAKTADAPEEPGKAAPATLAQQVQETVEAEEPEAHADEETEDAAPEAAAKAAAEEPAKTEIKPDKSARLKRLLESKKELAAVRDETAQTRQSAQQIIQAAQEEARRLVASAQAEIQAAVRTHLEDLKRSPMQAAARLGIDPQQLLVEQADEADPVRQLARKFEGELSARDKLLKEQHEALQALKRQDTERTQYLAQVQRTAAERSFLKNAEAPDFEFARALYPTNDALLKRANEVITTAAKAAQERGEILDVGDEEILEFLNNEARESFSKRAPSIAKLLQQVGAEAEKPKGDAKTAAGKVPAAGDAKPNGKAPAGTGQRPRTLAASSSGERRSPPQTQADKELSEAEFRKQAIRELKERKRAKAEE